MGEFSHHFVQRGIFARRRVLVLTLASYRIAMATESLSSRRVAYRSCAIAVFRRMRKGAYDRPPTSAQKVSTFAHVRRHRALSHWPQLNNSMRAAVTLGHQMRMIVAACSLLSLSDQMRLLHADRCPRHLGR